MNMIHRRLSELTLPPLDPHMRCLSDCATSRLTCCSAVTFQLQISLLWHNVVRLFTLNSQCMSPIDIPFIHASSPSAHRLDSSDMRRDGHFGDILTSRALRPCAVWYVRRLWIEMIEYEFDIFG